MIFGPEELDCSGGGGTSLLTYLCRLKQPAARTSSSALQLESTDFLSLVLARLLNIYINILTAHLTGFLHHRYSILRSTAPGAERIQRSLRFSQRKLGWEREVSTR